MIALTHRLDRTLVVRAARDTVFQYFTDTPRWASWWGAGSTIDARPGGRMVIRHANGVEVSGEVLEVSPPERIVFTYGYANQPQIPPGSSRVTIRLDSHPQGTLLQLTHEFSDVAPRDEHVQGWRFQLSLFANLIADTASRETSVVDRWFAAWGEPDAGVREREIDMITAPAVTFGDKYSCLDGADDLKAHLAAVQRFMPGVRLERRGAVRYCLWHALADWAAVGKDGQQRGSGTSVFVLDAKGRITSVTGFWAG
ncbi:MAG TPA: SRPBCC domain-containing protein [Vicinamibacterales bacterium]|nr:SRPBCC domain-containing protein [Vicinamibacterales bacterium]